MTSVSTLPQSVRQALSDRDVIVFDGECALCCGFFQTMLRLDTKQRFAFVTAQSPLGQALYAALNLPTDAFETNLVMVDGVIHQRLNAFAAAMGAMRGPWRALALLRHIPNPLRDWLYHRIARNRFAIFGRRDSCLVPTPDLRDRFLDLAPRVR